MKIDRLLSIIVILLNRDKITAKELSERFEVNIRTIYRDIESINMAGVPIISYPGNNGGFGIMENYKVSHQLLSLSDISSILAALRGINTSLENSDIKNAIEKIDYLVPETARESFLKDYEQISIDIIPWGHQKKRRDFLYEIQKAISKKNILQINYFDAQGNETVRTLEPMTLVLKGYFWYLFGFCLSRNDFRVFKISRIKSIENTQKYFERKSASYRDHFDLDYDQLKTLEIVLKFKKSYKSKAYEHFEDEICETLENGDFIVKFNFPESDWIFSFILSFGENAEVISPDYLREKMKNIIREMNDKYK